MQSVKLSENVYWVGAVDRDIRNMHGYLTPYGTTYNAYLVLDEQVTLIDTVKAPFAGVMLEHIREIVDPEKIDVIISNHVEPDHSGGLPALMKLCPDARVVTSPNGLKGLKAYYPDVPMNFEVVKTGDAISTGKYTFDFVLMPMVHWPDSMSTYLREQEILFCNDALGQHIASDERFDDEIGLERLLERAGDYYANIVLPFGRPVESLLGAVSGLAVALAAPSHGVVIRSHLPEMLQNYTRWAKNEPDAKRAVIVYDTMWGATRILAERLEAQFRAEGLAVETFCLTETHVSTAMAKLLDAGTSAVGSPTLNRQVMPTVGAFLAYLRGLSPKSRRGIPFGSYGWSGESVGMIQDVMTALGWEVVQPVKSVWWPEGAPNLSARGC